MIVRKVKIVWVCHFSSQEIREHIHFTKFLPSSYDNDFGIWNVNAIKQFEKYEDIELYVVFPHLGMKKRFQKFSINGINFICFKSEDDLLYARIIRKVFNYQFTRYSKNRKFISSVINDIKPDLVHIIGAENPYYSLSALDVPINIPCIVSLQTLMSAPDFLSNYLISSKEYDFRKEVEQKIINKATYIATAIDKFRKDIIEYVKEDAKFLNLDLALGVDINDSDTLKEYDFVYFAKNIAKAADFAIEAFAIAISLHPGLTMNISGDYSKEYKLKLDKRIADLGISNYVFFTGPQNSHENVIKQIKKSRYALLPIKVDFISSTIREAMACGLPVITTITPGTPILNEKRECVLLSENGDFKSMAYNMLKVVDDDSYAIKLRDNAFKTVYELYSNEAITNNWKRAYCEIVDNNINRIPLSNEIASNEGII